MILITLKRGDSLTVVSIAGRLDEEHLAELQEQCSAVPTKLAFDLSELKTADESAIHWLGKRHAVGDEILGASPYIKLLLERDEQSSEPVDSTGSRGGSKEGK